VFFVVCHVVFLLFCPCDQQSPRTLSFFLVDCAFLLWTNFTKRVFWTGLNHVGRSGYWSPFGDPPTLWEKTESCHPFLFFVLCGNTQPSLKGFVLQMCEIKLLDVLPLVNLVFLVFRSLSCLFSLAFPTRTKKICMCVHFDTFPFTLTMGWCG